ncbi:MAG: patatin-like phospholipase family protein [Oscillatoriaceae cyanobacterium Prado104]|jgi:patatin-like phospholipase/acyl hydrolase|nr:patatin-like phospholipase family protein [Oscillatoriaceae cyanobacterium Prado104]
MSNTKPYSILACDGGGLRGLVSAIILERLEQKLRQKFPNRQLRDYFDLIAGTSAGSLTACAVARGISATQIKRLYLERGIEIFPPFNNVFRSFVNRLVGGFATQPIYDGIGLRQVLQTVFGQENINFENLPKPLKPENIPSKFLLFQDLPKPVLITAYDIYNRQAVVFKNTKVAHEKVPVWEICRSSAAVPVAFPAHIMTHPDFLKDWQEEGYQIPATGNTRGIPLVDGGFVASNPSLCAIAERLRWNRNPPTNPKWRQNPASPWRDTVDIQDIVVASIGTGQNVKQIGIVQAQTWGAGEWINPLDGIPILDVFSDGSSDGIIYTINQLMSAEQQVRFQPILSKNYAAFNANQKLLVEMQQEIERSFLMNKKEDEKLNKLAAVLLARF